MDGHKDGPAPWRTNLSGELIREVHFLVRGMGAGVER